MAFLDNTGDIILDAVLTDEGRVRMAKGDFQIRKFALGDDEINYKLYNASAVPPDTSILSTPVFEAFTNNIASLNSRLVSFARTDILYMPTMFIHDKINGSTNYASDKLVKNGYVVAVDTRTEEMFADTTLKYNSDPASKGYIKGSTVSSSPFLITVDQGINNTEMPMLDPDLKEQNILMEMDNRFLIPVSPAGTMVDKSYVDEDYMASYYISLNDSTGIITNHPVPTYNGSDGGQANEVIKGGRGIRMQFSLAAGMDVSVSDALFNKLGTNVTSLFTTGTSGAAAGANIRTITTSIRMTGLTTGETIDVPVILVKKIS